MAQQSLRPDSSRAAGRRTERRAWWFYRLRGYRILEINAWIGGYELDLVARRGRQLVFCEVKGKAGDRFGDP
ncbi:MAG: YraN family protein, partial [Actinomycetota bacterium]|nr:YraN family protein [Actinomycetota bacterium]